jgi:hypothetical protein
MPESKPDDTVKLNLRLPKKLHRQLVQLGTFYNRSLNAEIIYRLEQAMAEGTKTRRPEGSLSDRLDKIEKTLESYAGLLKAQQKVAGDAMAALARASKKTDPAEGE